MKKKVYHRRERIKTYSLLAVICLLSNYALELEWFSQWLGPWEKYIPILKKFLISLFVIFVISLVGQIVRKLIKKSNEPEGVQYNLLRITKLVVFLLVMIVVTSFLFQNLYATVVSFGLISLILGFALQAPITSFISWLYIVFRKPYQVGDRIQINGYRGDVIEIKYLETLLLECSGDYLQNDRLSGRVVFFPNSMVLKNEIVNYSGPDVPFIWNETAIQIAFTSNLKYVEECLIQAAVHDFKKLYSQFNLDERTNWKPAVYFRVNKFSWLEAVISYPVEPTDTTGKRNRILREALANLNKEPNQVQFPEGTRR